MPRREPDGLTLRGSERSIDSDGHDRIFHRGISRHLARVAPLGFAHVTRAPHLPRVTRPAVTARGPAPDPAGRRLLVVGLGLFAAACGGGGRHGAVTERADHLQPPGSYSPPVPLRGVTMQVQFIVDVVDADGDWVPGQCQFVTGNQLAVPVETPAPGLPSNATSGTAVCEIIDVFDDETVQVDLAVVDQAGHQSNIVSGLVQLEGRRASMR